jgi:hypothetical protein
MVEDICFPLLESLSIIELQCRGYEITFDDTYSTIVNGRGIDGAGDGSVGPDGGDELEGVT